MRASLGPIDTKSLPWQQANEKVSFKLLNGSRTNGPYTILVRSEARSPNPPRGQYHPADEELFCLGGEFTFDGSLWFRKGSYAFYPAYFVHGANVHVRDGYELYLRISDTSALFWEDNPESSVPYLASGHDTDDHAVQLVAVTEQEYETPEISVEGLHVAPLHIAANTGAGSTLLVFDKSIDKIVIEARGLIEVFSLSGSFRTDSGAEMSEHSYMCSAGSEAKVTLSCEQAGDLVISHGGELCLRSVEAA